MIVHNLNDPKNESKRVTTDAAGYFELSVEPGEYVIGADSKSLGRALICGSEETHITVSQNQVMYVWICYPRDAYGGGGGSGAKDGDTHTGNDGGSKTGNSADGQDRGYTVMRYDVYDYDTNEKLPFGKVGINFYEDWKDIFEDEYFFMRGTGNSLALIMPDRDEPYYADVVAEGYEPVLIKIVTGPETDVFCDPIYMHKKKDTVSESGSVTEPVPDSGTDSMYDPDTPSESSGGWKEAYINYVRDNPCTKDLLMGYVHCYYLIDVNSDGIPELIDAIICDGEALSVTAVTYNPITKGLSTVSAQRRWVYIGGGTIQFIGMDQMDVYTIDGDFYKAYGKDVPFDSLMSFPAISESDIIDRIKEY